MIPVPPPNSPGDDDDDEADANSSFLDDDDGTNNSGDRVCCFICDEYEYTSFPYTNRDTTVSVSIPDVIDIPSTEDTLPSLFSSLPTIEYSSRGFFGSSSQSSAPSLQSITCGFSLTLIAMLLSWLLV